MLSGQVIIPFRSFIYGDLIYRKDKDSIGREIYIWYLYISPHTGLPFFIRFIFAKDISSLRGFRDLLDIYN